MDAVERDAGWTLSFDGRPYRTLRARDLWDRIMRATYDYAEPGVIFIDRVNALNNLSYADDTCSSNAPAAWSTQNQVSSRSIRPAGIPGSPSTARISTSKIGRESCRNRVGQYVMIKGG